MTKKKVKNLRISFSELIQRCIQISSFLKRDISLIKDYNIGENEIQAFMQEVNDFQKIAFDEKFLSKQMSATTSKDELKMKMISNIKNIQLRFKLQFGGNSVEYKATKSANIYLLGDDKLSNTAERIVKIAGEKLNDLKNTGLSEEMLANFSSDVIEFKKAIDSKNTAAMNRKTATLIRRQKMEQLYDKLTTFCNLGKFIWEGKDEAKYSGYVLYKK